MMFALFLFLIFKSKNNALWKLARGSMGEESAARENVACNNLANDIFNLDIHPHIVRKYDFLYSCFADKFICVHTVASGYNTFRFEHIFEGALMIERKGINGEMSFGL